jgi:hypothetical protein
MGARTDPWAYEPGFERYAGPRTDGFDPVDSQAAALQAFLQSQARPTSEASSEALPGGAHLIHREDQWELLVPTSAPGSYRIYHGRSRSEVVAKSIN